MHNGINVEELLMHVKQYPNLYNVRLQKEGQLRRKEIWQEIGRQMNFEAKLLKKKWNYIRDAYLKHEKNKGRLIRSKKKYRKPYRWAKQLEEIIPFLRSSNVCNNESSSSDNDYSNNYDDVASKSECRSNTEDLKEIQIEVLPAADNNDDDYQAVVESEDEYDVEGKFFARKFRNLPSRSVRLATERLLLDIILQAQLGNINDSTVITINSASKKTKLS